MGMLTFLNFLCWPRRMLYMHTCMQKNNAEYNNNKNNKTQLILHSTNTWIFKESIDGTFSFVKNLVWTFVAVNKSQDANISQEGGKTYCTCHDKVIENFDCTKLENFFLVSSRGSWQGQRDTKIWWFLDTSGRNMPSLEWLLFPCHLQIFLNCIVVVTRGNVTYFQLHFFVDVFQGCQSVNLWFMQFNTS